MEKPRKIQGLLHEGRVFSGRNEPPDFVGAAGDKDHGLTALDVASSPEEIGTVHVSQMVVHHKESWSLGSEGRQGLSTGSICKNGIAFFPKGPGHDLAEILVVVHDENVDHWLLFP